MACDCAKIVQDTAGACSPSNGKYVIQKYDCATEQPIVPAQLFKESTATFETAGYTLYNAIGDSSTPGTAAYAASTAGISTSCLATIRLKVIGAAASVVTLEAKKKLAGVTYAADLSPGVAGDTIQIVPTPTTGTTVTITIPAGGCMDFLRLNFLVSGSPTITIQGKTTGFAADCGSPSVSDNTGDIVPSALCWGYQVTIS